MYTRIINYQNNQICFNYCTVYPSKIYSGNIYLINRNYKNVLLFMDNSPSHPKDQTSSNVKVPFFSANTTSKLQPLDQGIIKCLKSHYRKQLLRKVITHQLLKNYQKTWRVNLFSDTRIRLQLKKTMKTLTRSHKNKSHYSK